MRRIALAVALAGAVYAPTITAQTSIVYQEDSLANGLHFFMVEDHSTPIVTVDVWYDVGSRNERPGHSGFAHLFEHMMFQGSAHVKKGEHFKLVERAGGNANGTTTEDRTNYFETLPSNRLNLGLWLEADRMRSLAITDSNFENQREVVKEERRLRVDNQPYAAAFNDGLTLIYDSTTCFGYAHSTIGSMDDLNAAHTPDVRQFFNLYYAPNNANIVIVGDFEPAHAKQLMQQYFGGIPRVQAPPPFKCDVHYDAGAGRKVWQDPLANLPAVLIAYLTPPHRIGEDTRPLALLTTILGQGESSRLNRSLVREQQVALQAGAFNDSRRGPGEFIVYGIANQGQTADSVEAALRAQVADIVQHGVTQEELEKARNDFRASNIFGRQTTMEVAERIQHYVHFHNAVDEINTDLPKYMAVTAADIQRVAAKYLVPANSYTIVVVPKRASAGSEEKP